MIRSETAASEWIIEEGINLERAVQVSEYRVEQDKGVCEAPRARTLPKPEIAKWILARTTEGGVLEGTAEEGT
jgi:hypothetical protein